MDLLAQRCQPVPKGTPAMSPERVAELLPRVPGWQVSGNALVRTEKLPSFAAAIAFVNRVAAVADAEDHHPDIDIRYDTVTVRSWTHTVGGLSLCDFILAAKIDAAR